MCYGWVKKCFEGIEVVVGVMVEQVIVYNCGMLFGVWFDGEVFEGNCYVDCYVICYGLIVQMDVWNDSVECLLVCVGLVEL